MSPALVLLLALQASPTPMYPATEAWARGEIHMRTPGAAEAFNNAISDARAAGLDRSRPEVTFTLFPFATVSALGSWEEPKEVMSLYAYRLVGGMRAVAIRRFDMLQNDVKWASSAECPGLAQAVERLERVEPPTIDVPLFGEYESDAIGPSVKDGVSYTLWVRNPAWSGPGDARYLSASYSSSSPLEEWYDAVNTAAVKCWSSTPPAAH